MSSLGGLGLMTLGTHDTTVSDLEVPHHVVAEDPPPQRWTSTSAELWPVCALVPPHIYENDLGELHMFRFLRE